MKILHGKHNCQYKLRSWELKLKNKTKNSCSCVSRFSSSIFTLLHIFCFLFISSHLQWTSVRSDQSLTITWLLLCVFSKIPHAAFLQPHPWTNIALHRHLWVTRLLLDQNIQYKHISLNSPRDAIKTGNFIEHLQVLKVNTEEAIYSSSINSYIPKYTFGFG